MGGWGSLTHFTDSKGAGVAGVDLGRPAPGEVEQLHQARDHLVLLLGVAQAAIATKAPGEDALLRVQDQLWEEKQCWDGLLTGGDERVTLWSRELLQQLMVKGRNAADRPNLPPPRGAGGDRAFPLPSAGDATFHPESGLSHKSLPGSSSQARAGVSRGQVKALASLITV